MAEIVLLVIKEVVKVFRQSDVECMQSMRLRGNSLSNHTKVEAGYNTLIYCCHAYFVYTLLVAGCYSSFFIFSIS